MECVQLRHSEQQALETTETVLTALAGVPDRDEAIDRLIAAIVRERVQLLAATAQRAAGGPGSLGGKATEARSEDRAPSAPLGRLRTPATA